MDGLYWKTLLKWMIWGYHYFRKHPCIYFFKVFFCWGISKSKYGFEFLRWLVKTLPCCKELLFSSEKAVVSRSWTLPGLWNVRRLLHLSHHLRFLCLVRIVVPQNGWFIMENPIKMDDCSVAVYEWLLIFPRFWIRLKCWSMAWCLYFRQLQHLPAAWFSAQAPHAAAQKMTLGVDVLQT